MANGASRSGSSPALGRLRRLALGGLVVAGLASATLSNAGAGEPISVVADAAVAAASITTTTTPAPTTTSTTAPPPTTSTTAPPPMVASPELCGLLHEHLDGLRRMAVSLTDPKKLRALVEGAGPAVGRALPMTPLDARPDVSLLASTIADFRRSLDVAGYDITRLSAEMVTTLQSPVVVDAMSRLDRWAKGSC